MDKGGGSHGSTRRRNRTFMRGTQFSVTALLLDGVFFSWE